MPKKRDKPSRRIHLLIEESLLDRATVAYPHTSLSQLVNILLDAHLRRRVEQSAVIIDEIEP